MDHITVILRLPIMPPPFTGPEYIRGFVDATLAPVHAAIEDGVLHIDAMLDAGWELDIPEVFTSTEGDLDSVLA